MPPRDEELPADPRLEGRVVTILRALKERWFLVLAVCVLALGVNLLLKQVYDFFGYAAVSQDYASKPEANPAPASNAKPDSTSKPLPISLEGSASHPYVQVLHTGKTIGMTKRNGYRRGIITVTVKNRSDQCITELQGTVEYIGGNGVRQTATLQFEGKIPPRGTEKIRAYVEIPRMGGIYGSNRVTFDKIKVE